MRSASALEAELTMDRRGESSHGSVTDEKKAAGEHVLGVDEYESEMPDMYAFLILPQTLLCSCMRSYSSKPFPPDPDEMVETHQLTLRCV